MGPVLEPWESYWQAFKVPPGAPYRNKDLLGLQTSFPEMLIFVSRSGFKLSKELTMLCAELLWNSGQSFQKSLWLLQGLGIIHVLGVYETSHCLTIFSTMEAANCWTLLKTQLHVENRNLLSKQIHQMQLNTKGNIYWFLFSKSKLKKTEMCSLHTIWSSFQKKFSYSPCHFIALALHHFLYWCLMLIILFLFLYYCLLDINIKLSFYHFTVVSLGKNHLILSESPCNSKS